jgi:hypothetical protein
MYFRVYIQQRSPRYRIGVVPDMSAVIPLYHDHARIMVHGHHAHGHPGEQLAHDAGMPQGVQVASRPQRQATRLNSLP